MISSLSEAVTPKVKLPSTLLFEVADLIVPSALAKLLLTAALLTLCTPLIFFTTASDVPAWPVKSKVGSEIVVAGGSLIGSFGAADSPPPHAVNVKSTNIYIHLLLNILCILKLMGEP